MMLTVTASEARANFSKLGEEIVRTGEPVTVFKNSKPWLMISPMSELEEVKDAKPSNNTLKKKALQLAQDIDEEYFDVFETLSR